VPFRRVRQWVADRPLPLSLGLVATVFAFDLSMPLGVAAAVPYTFAVLLALRARPGWVGPAVAGLCGVLTVTKMVILPDRGTTELWKVIVNRGLALFAVGMTTLLGVLRRQSEAERVAAEEKLRAHQADLAHLGRLSALGQLATALAHELNQPLAAVRLHADIAGQLAAGTPTPPAVTSALSEIRTQSERAGEVVKAMRRMAARTTPGHDPIDLNAAVRVVIGLIDWQARRAGVELHFRPASAPLPVVSGDPVQIEQVVLNLVQNAIDATANRPAPRTVWVETAAADTEVSVCVRDTGPGLADPDQVFDRFYTTKPDGLGMGLAISRAIVEAHGGKLWAASPPGRGAEFTFTLPGGQESGTQ
jgi:signal transduction histidine kinase